MLEEILKGATRGGSKAAHLRYSAEDEVVKCCKDLIHNGEPSIFVKYCAAQLSLPLGPPRLVTGDSESDSKPETLRLSWLRL